MGVFIARRFPKHALWNDDATALLKPDGTEVGHALSLSAEQVTAVVANEAKASRGGSILRHGKPWMRQPATLPGGIAYGGSATGAIANRRGRQCLEITSPANASLQSFYFPITPSVVTNRQHMTFEVEDAEQWRGGTWRIGFYTSGAFTDGVRATFTADSYNGFNGVRCVAPLATEWSNIGGGSFASTMTYCLIQFQRKSGATGDTKLWYYEIAEGEANSLPSIVIAADDGAKNWYTDGLPIVEKYGFSCGMAFIADDRGTATRMSAAEWYDAIVTRGHHAVVHGCKTGKTSLADYFSDYTGYASAYDAILADITYNRDIMVSEALDPDGLGRMFYVLPQGKHQPNLTTAGDITVSTALAAAGMTGGRIARVQNAIISNGGWAGASMYIPIIGHIYAGAGEATNITDIVTRMQDEIGAGRSVVLMFHEVRASPSANEHITAANLETIVAAAATLVRSGTARSGRLTHLARELATYTSPVHVGQ